MSLISNLNYPNLLRDFEILTITGLVETPQDLTPLVNLMKYQGVGSPQLNQTYALAIKILRNELFQEHPGSLYRLTPLANRYIQIINRHELSLGALWEIESAHKVFEAQYIKEYLEKYPYELPAILYTYPKTIRQILTAFTKQMKEVPDEIYASWKESAEGAPEVLMPIFMRLSVYDCIKSNTLQIPEIYQNMPIDTLRRLFSELSFDEQARLLERLRGEDVQGVSNKVRDLFTLIAGIEYQISPPLFNGITRVIYYEIGKYFRLLGAMEFDITLPHDPLSGLKAAFLALLRQENLGRMEDLPLEFMIPNQAFYAKQREYQSLTDAEKRSYENAFLQDTTTFAFDTEDLFNDLGKGALHLLYRSRRDF